MGEGRQETGGRGDGVQVHVPAEVHGHVVPPEPGGPGGTGAGAQRVDRWTRGGGVDAVES